jgi:hypothetical protein
MDGVIEELSHDSDWWNEDVSRRTGRLGITVANTFRSGSHSGNTEMAPAVASLVVMLRLRTSSLRDLVLRSA